MDDSYKWMKALGVVGVITTSPNDAVLKYGIQLQFPATYDEIDQPRV